MTHAFGPSSLLDSAHAKRLFLTEAALGALTVVKTNREIPVVVLDAQKAFHPRSQRGRALSRA